MQAKHPRVRAPFVLPYHSVRNISCPDDLANNRKVYVGQTQVFNVLEISTDENVRDYLLEAEGKKRKRPTQVHKAIHDTLKNNPENFTVLNSGLVIVARSCNIDEKNNRLELIQPSIINGSQTQGVVRDFLKEEGIEHPADYPAYVKYEIIVTDNDDLIAETSIARNFQNDVMTISIAGRLGQLDELEKSLSVKLPGSKLKKSETKLSEDYVNTEKLLQVIAALVPESLWVKGSDFNKVYTYAMKTRCLKDFQEIYEKAHNPSDKDYAKYRDLYDFYLDICGVAYELYEKWKSHPCFKGTGLRAIERENGEIVDVPDGIVFPIIASLSVFAKKTNDGWHIVTPSVFSDKELINTAKSVYMEIAGSNPWNMGKSKACYSALYQITSIYQKFNQLQK